MKLSILDYGSGNLRSVEQAVRRAALDVSAQTGRAEIQVALTDKADEAATSDFIILPGVGHFADCWASLSATDGMLDMLADQVVTKGKPFLGICVGMQLMANRGFEGVETKGLGWIDGDVISLAGGLDETGATLKIPHMGWNKLQFQQPNHALCQGLQENDQLYFLHSYHMRLNPGPNGQDSAVAMTHYGEPVTAMVTRDNMCGTQFHPEKSQILGQKLLRNFLSWRP